MLFFEAWQLALARAPLLWLVWTGSYEPEAWSFLRDLSPMGVSLVSRVPSSKAICSTSNGYEDLMRSTSIPVSYTLNPTSCLIAKPLAEAVLSFSVELSTTLTEAAVTCFSPSKRVKITGTSCRKWNFNSSTPFLHFCCDSQAGINSV